MNCMFENDWEIILTPIINQTNILNIIKKEYQTKDIYPKYENIFKAFNLCSYSNIKVVIVGQDPYHGFDEANGLCFSVNNNKMTPSLNNIFKELQSDLGIARTNSDLSDWAGQGILLLNTILTVEKDKPLSHQYIGWEEITNYVIKQINDRIEPVIFVLWGNNAQRMKTIITNNRHYIIESSHPSPLSSYRGFIGSKPFSKINKILRSNNIKEIEWSD
jgi:uracil-DNA glycosylase